MGYALIVGGGTDGRYTISLDIGEAQRTALVDRFTARAAEAVAELAAAQVVLDEKTAELDMAAEAYNAATVAYIELLRGEVDVESGEQFIEIVNGHAKAQAAYLVARVAHSAALLKKNALSLSSATIAKALADWQAQVLTETRDAWCTDFTEEAAGYVATMEIPGESELILIAPGGRQPVLATDGYLRSRGLMAPWQAFANAAILPGWQKWKPTYRWGTITALDEAANTATVAIAEARSSAHRLLVNQAATLVDVPVVYMECNASAFDVGDRVVVEFQGQDWSSPRVVGFLDNPKTCNWTCTQNAGGSGGYIFEAEAGELLDAISSGSVSVQVQVKIIGSPENEDWTDMVHSGASYTLDFSNGIPQTPEFDPWTVSLVLNVYSSGVPFIGYPPCVNAIGPAPFPFSAGGPADTSQYIYEFRIIYQGDLVGNFAYLGLTSTDYTELADNYRAKSTGGYKRKSYSGTGASSPGVDVLPLDYVLTGNS